MKIFKYFLLIFIVPTTLLSQEIISDLAINPILKEGIKNASFSKSKDTTVYKLLPFMDDFSLETVYPQPLLWSDRYAFINNSFPINPVTVGVATLDALNDSGMIYSHANNSSFIADYLTSQYIRLDSVLQGANLIPLKVSDSVYLSFYYQPQGIGNKPEGQDSLVLEFFSVSDSSWHWIWSAPGQSYQSFHDACACDFKQVMIPVTDSALYFYKDFKFRFYNYASIANSYEPSWAGNVDQWHIDYVYMNKTRHINDTIYEDVAFSTKPLSLLTTYQSMPWPHYNASTLMNSSEALPYVNLSNITKNVSRQFSIIDLSDNSVAFNYSGGNLNLNPFASEPFSAPVSYTFSTTSADSALFELRGVINTTPDINRSNDTIRFYQRFNNYYAYDDGTPENGYGLTTNTAQLAYKFTTTQADTLKGIQMFFNKTYQSANSKYFTLRIWSGTTEPQQVIYEKTNLLPMFESELNKFHTYHIDTPLVLNGTFFIGWKQTTADNLNIGFDRNTNASNNIFYNVSGTWLNSMYSGSLMIRPVFGKFFNVSAEQPKIFSSSIRLYPNPSNGKLFFVFEDGLASEFNLTITDLTGRVVFTHTLSPEIELDNDLQNGLYFYTITSSQNPVPVAKGKFILHR
ncbi:MAG: hypothetical protein BWY70_00832 [Bacteroidetes bacterium ADurb.Bin408]|nr:MAG: hypothetical protein BWY70_00832 [Bacteroidetes bacterium ADurb.Bin408]